MDTRKVKPIKGKECSCEHIMERGHFWNIATQLTSSYIKFYCLKCQGYIVDQELGRKIKDSSNYKQAKKLLETMFKGFKVVNLAEMTDRFHEVN